MKSFYLLAHILFLNIGILCAQTVDNSFHKPVPYRPAKINVIKVLPDGKILLGGDITFFKDKRVNNLIRVNADGSLDEEFNFNGNNNLLIERVELQSSGDMVVLAQQYVSLTETYSYISSLYWVDTSGTIKKEIHALPYVSSIDLQDDDKVLACGIKNPVGFLYRYNSDLTIDDSFDNAMSFNDQVNDVVFKNGKIYAAGTFSQVKDTIEQNIVKLNLSGAIDTTFNSGTGTPDYIKSLTILEDGSMLIGNIYTFDGLPTGSMVKLNPDGSVDTSFLPPQNYGPYSPLVVRNSFVYFSSYAHLNGKSGAYVFKMNPSGQLDPAFNPILIDDKGFDDFHMDVSQNNLLYNNSSFRGNVYGVSQSDSVGSLIGSFAPEVSRYGTLKVGDSFNGKMVVSGDFIRIDSNVTFGIAMTNEDGTIDQSFSLKENLGKPIQIEVLNDTSLLFSTGKSLVKLNTKAQIMPEFHFNPFKTLYEVLKFRVLENGKIYAANEVNVYRLNTDGTEDTSFDIGTGIGGFQSSTDFDIQDDRVIFGSIFDHFNGIPVNRLVRLNSDGSVDQTFNMGSGPNAHVTMVKVLSTGEMIIGGKFNSFNGIAIPHGLLKLGPDGQFDTLFNANQKLYASMGVKWHNTKVEQSDTMLYIKATDDLFGTEKVIAVNINGKFYSDFTLQVTVDRINDIIVPEVGLQLLKMTKSTSLKTRKSTSVEGCKSYLFALGNFKSGGIGGTSFMEKLVFENKSLPTGVVVNGNSSACKGASVTYSAVASNTTSYAWTVPTGWTISSGQGTSSISVITGSNSGRVCATPSNCYGIGSSVCYSITINEIPDKPTVIDGETNPILNEMYEYTIDLNPGADKYLWNVTGGNLDVNNNSTFVTWNSLGEHNLSVKSENNCGTSDSAILLVNVKEIPTQLQTTIPENMEVYPNPTSGYLRINLENQNNTCIGVSITDLAGKIAFYEEYEGIFDNNGFSIDISHLQNGIYILTIKSEDLIKIEKIIKN